MKVPEKLTAKTTLLLAASALIAYATTHADHGHFEIAILCYAMGTGLIILREFVKNGKA